MKRMRFLLPLFSLFITLTAFAPADDSEAVVGTWLNGTKKGHVQIYKQGGTYFGKLVWLGQPNRPGYRKAQNRRKKC